MENEKDLIAHYLLGRIAYHQDYRREDFNKIPQVPIQHTLAFSLGFHDEGSAGQEEDSRITVVETVKSYLEHGGARTENDPYLGYLDSYLGARVDVAIFSGEDSLRLLEKRAAVLLGLKDQAAKLPPREEKALKASIKSMMPHPEGG